MDTNIYFENLGYTISDSITLLDEEFNVTADIQELINDAYHLSTGGKKSGIKTIQKYIKRFPKIPHFKNYLVVLYTKTGNNYKANEINKILLNQHPDYLFGKLNLASSYYYKGQHLKMAEVLGYEMDLKALYPEKDTFQLSEVLNFLKITVLYYFAANDSEKAELNYETLKDIEQRFELDSTESDQVFRFIASLRMQRIQENLSLEEKTKIKVNVVPKFVEQKTEPPIFTNPEINMLYENDFSIGKQKLEQILSLPRESLIEDLLKVLLDSIERYEYFENEMDNIGYSDEKHSFPVHAFFLLGELEAESSLQVVLNYLKQDYDFYDFWYSDTFTEYFWEPMFKIGHNKLEELKLFMMEPGVDTHTKLLVNEVALQLALRTAEGKKDVIKWYKDIFTHFLNSKIEDNIIDSDLIAFMTCSVIDFKGIELLPEIEMLYNMGCATHSVAGDIDEVKNSFEEANLNESEEILPIIKRYEKFVRNWYDSNDSGNENVMPKNQITNFEPNKLNEQEKKVGRNEPCPCGSGKKYKKCCLNN